MKVAVIGAGPSGLVTLKYLLHAHEALGCEAVEALIFDDQDDVGGTFLARAYEDAELVSSKQLTTFSDFRHPGHEDFLSAPDYVTYLRDYCTHFELWSHIKLRTRVVSIRRGASGARPYVVQCEQDGLPTEWECDAIAVCSGLHVEPNVPQVAGLENVAKVMHSSQFKLRSQFDGSGIVMVLGLGETGADISYLAATHPTVERVVICHRDGVHFAPKRNPGPVLLPILGRKPDPTKPGIPIDISKASLFDTAYVHQSLRRNDWLLWEYYNVYIKTLLWLSSGTTAGLDQWVGEISPARHHPSKIFFNKSNKICSLISDQYRPRLPGPRLWLYALRSAIVQTPVPETRVSARVDLAPWPQSFSADGTVKFLDSGRPEYYRLASQRIRPDVVVLCTGYKHGSSIFERNEAAPFPSPESADVRQIWHADEPSIGFIGFVRPSLGAIPPLAEMQAQLWILRLLAPSRIPRPLRVEDQHHYRLVSTSSSRIRYGVEHESYVYQLGLDMDSVPSFECIAASLSPRLLLVWSLGANLNTKFRLQGPWAWDGAAGVLQSDEIWQTITRRPILFGHVAGSLLPISIFGPINFALWLVGLLSWLGGLALLALGLCHPSSSSYRSFVL